MLCYWWCWRRLARKEGPDAWPWHAITPACWPVAGGWGRPQGALRGPGGLSGGWKEALLLDLLSPISNFGPLASQEDGWIPRWQGKEKKEKKKAGETNWHWHCWYYWLPTSYDLKHCWAVTDHYSWANLHLTWQTFWWTKKKRPPPSPYHHSPP